MADGARRRRPPHRQLSAYRQRAAARPDRRLPLTVAGPPRHRLVGTRTVRLRAWHGRDHGALGDLAFGDRPQPRSQRRVAVPGPEHHRPVPADHLRQPAAVPRRARTGRSGNRPSPRHVFPALPRCAGGADHAPARTPRYRGGVRRALDPLTHPAPVRRRAAAVQPGYRRPLRCTGHLLRQRLERCGGEPAGAQWHEPGAQRPLQGRLDHPPLQQHPGRRA